MSNPMIKGTKSLGNRLAPWASGGDAVQVVASNFAAGHPAPAWVLAQAADLIDTAGGWWEQNHGVNHSNACEARRLVVQLRDMSRQTECPNCGRTKAECPECERRYHHGTADHCTHPPCVAVNAPLDCMGCMSVVVEGVEGILTINETFIPYKRG